MLCGKPNASPTHLTSSLYNNLTGSTNSKLSSFGRPPTLLSSTIPGSFLKFMSTELVKLSNHLILCCPLLLLPSIFPSIEVFSNESTLHNRWPKVLELQHYSFQLKSINSLVLSLLYCPTLTSIHDYWENHSFDWRDLCRESEISASLT